MRRSATGTLLALLLLPWGLAAQDDGRCVEVRSPNFTVVSDAGQNEAQRVVADHERFRSVISAALPQFRVDSNKPVIILAIKEAEAFLRLLPGFQSEPGRVRPSGAFIQGEEKHYAVVQLSGGGRDSTHILYH